MMVQDNEKAMTPPTSESVASSPAAERMRRHRQRKRDRLIFMTIELRKSEVDGLIKRGLLGPETRNDVSAIRNGLYSYFEKTLGAKS